MVHGMVGGNQAGCIAPDLHVLQADAPEAYCQSLDQADHPDAAHAFSLPVLLAAAS